MGRTSVLLTLALLGQLQPSPRLTPLPSLKPVGAADAPSAPAASPPTPSPAPPLPMPTPLAAPLSLTPPKAATPSPGGAAADPSPALAVAPAAPLKEDLATFDSMGVLLTWSGRGWQLMANGTVLKDFGRRENEARQALRLIRELRLTQRGAVGGAQPAMEYWLSSGQAPQGLTPGTATLPLDPAALKLEQQNGQWLLRDGPRLLVNFGRREAEARQGLAVLQKYGFNQVALVGPGGSGMQVFLSKPEPAHAEALVGRSRPLRGSAEAPEKAPAPASALDRLVTPALAPPAGGPPEGPPGVKPNVHGGASGSAERVPFDWRQLQLRQEGGAWKLRAGGQEFADFGSDERDARLALTALQYYRVNEQRLLGSSPGSTSYFLSNGQAPRGLALGVPGPALRPETLSVAPVGAGWAVCSNGQPLLTCSGGDEARRLLEAIRQYKFDHVCRFGPPNSQLGLTLLVRTN
jgi:hypothetical protein